MEVPPEQLSFDPEFSKSFLRSRVCQGCPFLPDGCDFVSAEPPPACLPCGGLVLLSGLLRKEMVTETDITHADLLHRAKDSYVSPTRGCSIKRLEQHYLYHVVSDELYEVNDEAIAMLEQCDGTHLTKDLNPDPAFLEFCLEEDLLEILPEPRKTDLHEGRSPIPSLRYLEWLVTFRCNLSCSHCYLGEQKAEEFPKELINSLLDQFTRMQGLRILVSGGEPTLYRHFHALNAALKDYPIRAVLLTNGIMLDDSLAAGLNFHEVQVSLDGMEKGHDSIRGKGTFQRALRAMKAVRSAGLDLSVATMIHRGNLDEWQEMRDLILEVGAREWSIDYPCVKGRWEANPGLAVSPDVAAEKMRLAFGGSYHGTSQGWTCGRHLAAVLPSGEVCKCGLFPDHCFGSVKDGLADAWMKLEHIPIRNTKCSGCVESETCGGGCRYRAGGPTERDEGMCRFYGISDRPKISVAF